MVEPLLSKLGIELKFYDVKPMQSNVKKELINLYPFTPLKLALMLWRHCALHGSNHVLQLADLAQLERQDASPMFS